MDRNPRPDLFTQSASMSVDLSRMRFGSDPPHPLHILREHFGTFVGHFIVWLGAEGLLRNCKTYARDPEEWWRERERGSWCCLGLSYTLESVGGLAKKKTREKKRMLSSDGQAWRKSPPQVRSHGPNKNRNNEHGLWRNPLYPLLSCHSLCFQSAEDCVIRNVTLSSSSYKLLQSPFSIARKLSKMSNLYPYVILI